MNDVDIYAFSDVWNIRFVPTGRFAVWRKGKPAIVDKLKAVDKLSRNWEHEVRGERMIDGKWIKVGDAK